MHAPNDKAQADDCKQHESCYWPVNRLHRISELRPSPRLDLDERDRSFALYHQIDVPMPRPKPTLNHTPALAAQPSLR